MAKGFTLIELMITIALAAIILSLAGPGFQELVRRNQVRAITDDFYTVFNTARSEAVKRNSQVVLCASSAGVSCDGATWDSGWLMFIDDDGNGDVNGAEPIVQVGSALPANYTLRAGAPYSTAITLNPDGSVNGISGTFRICSPEADAVADTDESRSITFLSYGGPRLQKGAAVCP